MPILSPEDRAVLWQKAISSDSEERPAMLRILAKEVLDVVGGHFSLYGGFDDEMAETVQLLDTAGYLARDDLRHAFEEADEDEEHMLTLLARLVGYLRETADVDRLSADERVRALQLAGEWREHLLDSAEGKEHLTVAEVAARFDLTPQAVYKWIKQGKVQADKTPGGSYRLPARQFEQHRRIDRQALDAVQQRLLRRAADAGPASDEDIAAEVVARRR